MWAWHTTSSCLPRLLQDIRRTSTSTSDHNRLAPGGFFQEKNLRTACQRCSTPQLSKPNSGPLLRSVSCQRAKAPTSTVIGLEFSNSRQATAKELVLAALRCLQKFNTALNEPLLANHKRSTRMTIAALGLHLVLAQQVIGPSWHETNSSRTKFPLWRL